MKQGYELIGKDGTISIKKNENEFIFDRKIKSGDGILYGIQIRDHSVNKLYNESKKRINYHDMHNKLGFAGEALTRNTANI